MSARDPADDVVSLYERYARSWMAVRSDDGFAERAWFDRLITALPQSATSILDLGCGSGAPIAAFMADKGFAITGVDSAPSLLAAFRERLPTHAAIAADMRALNLGKRFDGLIAWHSFFHLRFDEQRAFIPVLARHAAPGAALMFTSGDSHGEAIAQFGADPLYHASLAPDEYRALLEASDFSVLRYGPRDGEAGGSCVWLCKMRA